MFQSEHKKKMFLHRYRSRVENSLRKINIFPTIGDIYSSRPEIKPNIIDGPYDSVDHYLDVQFRLFHEDFMRPLREGIQQYSHEMQFQTTGGKKRDGIFVHKNISLIWRCGQYICSFNKNMFRNVDWKVKMKNK